MASRRADRICFVAFSSRDPVSTPGSRARGHASLENALVFADQLVDAALQLALFLFALAQPRLEIGDRRLMVRAERDADEIVAPPDHLGEEGTALSRDGEPDIGFRQRGEVAEF